MPRHKILTLLFIATVAVAVLAMSGCKDSPTRQAGKDIRQAVSQAQRLCDSARALMSAAVLVDTAGNGEYPPFTRKIPDIKNESTLDDELAKIQIPTTLPSGSDKGPKAFVGDKPKYVYQISEDLNLVREVVAERPTVTYTDPNPKNKNTVKTVPEGKGAYAEDKSKALFDVTVTPLNPAKMVNPKALALLKTAETDLTKAIKEYSQASSDDILLAQMALARVQSMIGEYYTLSAGPYADAVRNGIYRSRKLIGVLRTADGVAAFLDGMIGASDEIIKKAVDGEKAREDGTRKQIADIEDKISKQETARKGLEQQIAARRTTIGELMAKSKLTPGEEGIKYFDQAQQLEAEVYKAQSQIDDIENDIKIAKDKIVDLTIIANSAKTSATLCQELLTSRGSQKEMVKQVRTELAARIDEYRKMLVGNIADCVNYWKPYNEAHDGAKTAFESAIATFGAADAKAQNEKRVWLLGQSGDTKARLGQNDAHSYELQAEIKKFADDIRAAFKTTVPAGTDELAKIPEKMEDVKAAAVAAFGAAIESSQAAMDKMNKSDLKWAYQGRLAGIYIAQLKLAPSADTEEKAKKLVDEALANKELSPLLVDIRRLREILSGNSSGSSTVQPSSAPAAP